jgi:hypothetical protein
MQIAGTNKHDGVIEVLAVSLLKTLWRSKPGVQNEN